MVPMVGGRRIHRWLASAKIAAKVTTTLMRAKVLKG
jgi:hypothetical protein